VKRELLALATLTLALATPAPALAQKGAGQKAKPKTAEAQDPLRQQAVSMLNGLVNEAADVTDTFDRVVVQTEVADALWPVDEARARELFAASFREIEKLAADSEPERSQAARRMQTLRQRVLSRVSKRDPKLANTLVRSVPAVPPTAEQRWQQMYGASTPQGEALLGLATQALRTDIKQAVALARYALPEGLSQSLRLFLLRLRAKDQAAADALFEEALGVAQAARPGRLFDVLVVWDYAYQPPLFYLGGVSWPRGKEEPRFPVKDALRQKAIAFAVRALGENALQLSEAAPPEADANERRAQLSNLYSVIQQLLPTIEAAAPDSANSLRAQLSGLEQDLRTAGQKLPGPPQAEEESDAAGDDVEALLARAFKAGQGEAGDGLYMKAAFKLFERKQYERAAEAASKIGDPARRAMIEEPVNFNRAGELIVKGDPEEALRVAARLKTPLLRVNVMAKAGAAYLEKKDYSRWATVLGEAQTLADKIDPSIDLGAATLGIASAFGEHDALRAFEALTLSVQIINKVPADVRLWNVLSPLGGGQLSVYNYEWKDAGDGGMTSFKAAYPRPAGLADVMSQLSRLDFDRTVSLARQLKAKNLSLVVQTSIARKAIEGPPDAAPQAKRVASR